MSRAHPLNNTQLDHLLQHITASSNEKLRDYVVVLLSFKAGLRVGEIAALRWGDVLDVTGAVGDEVQVREAVAKYGVRRDIPMHPALKVALCALRATMPAHLTRARDPIVRGSNGAMKPNTLTVYLRRLYHAAGLCTSSHAGRRTLITKLAQTANVHGCSIYDVQAVAGHRDVSTTEIYVERSKNVAQMLGAV